MGCQFFVSFFIWQIMYYCRDHFWGPLSESRQFRGSIRRPVLKKHGFQCKPGIDGGVEQKNMGSQYFVSFLYSKLCIIAAITSGAP